MPHMSAMSPLDDAGGGERAAEVAVGLLEFEEFGDQAVETGIARAGVAGHGGERADVAAGEVAAELGEAAGVAGDGVGQDEGVVIARGAALEDALQRQVEARGQFAGRKGRRRGQEQG